MAICKLHLQNGHSGVEIKLILSPVPILLFPGGVNSISGFRPSKQAYTHMSLGLNGWGRPWIVINSHILVLPFTTQFHRPKRMLIKELKQFITLARLLMGNDNLFLTEIRFAYPHTWTSRCNLAWQVSLGPRALMIKLNFFRGRAVNLGSKEAKPALSPTISVGRRFASRWQACSHDGCSLRRLAAAYSKTRPALTPRFLASLRPHQDAAGMGKEAAQMGERSRPEGHCDTEQNCWFRFDNFDCKGELFWFRLWPQRFF